MLSIFFKYFFYVILYQNEILFTVSHKHNEKSLKNLIYHKKMYRLRQIRLFFEKCFKKKTTEYFLKFLCLFESTILPVNNGK